MNEEKHPLSRASVHRIHFRKSELKFASAHMTVFPDGSKEALHGHNYITEVSLDLESIELSQMVPFSSFKTFILKICEEWDEKVLLQKNCPFFKILSETSQDIEFLLCKKRYILPRDEVILLPLDNIATETLANLFCQKLLNYLETQNFFQNIRGIQVKIEESPGQGSTRSFLL